MTRILILILVLCAPVLCQQPVDQDDVVRVETDVTNLPFTAMDKQRRFVTTLRAEDVRVLEDGVPQQLFTDSRISCGARSPINSRSNSS